MINLIQLQTNARSGPSILLPVLLPSGSLGSLAARRGKEGTGARLCHRSYWPVFSFHSADYGEREREGEVEDDNIFCLEKNHL